MFTYILKTIDGEYYCGKAKDIDKRIKQHKNPNKKSWFHAKNRTHFEIIYLFEGDFEKYIKQCGVARISNLIYMLLPPTMGGNSQ